VEPAVSVVRPARRPLESRRLYVDMRLIDDFPDQGRGLRPK
jgi:hypothetical protein